MKRPLAISLSPNTEPDDLRLAFETFFSFGKWFAKNEVDSLTEEFEKRFGHNFKALPVNAGRGAQYLILKALGISQGAEVALQAFTCTVVPNSILWTGAKPVYVDIDESYNLDPKDLEKKISPQTKAVIVQHTFGIPANISSIQKIARERNLILIEDCAHSLGTKYGNQEVGTFGEASFFSFGRDKVISSVFGGAILCPNGKNYEKIEALVDQLEFPPAFWVGQQIFHPLAMSFILPTYDFGLGKLLLYIFQKLNFLSKAIYEKEKSSKQPSFFPKKFPGGLAILAKNQLEKLEKFNHHRKELAEFYFSELKDSSFCLPPKVKDATWLRFPVRHPKSSEIFQEAKRQGVLLGDWYKEVVTPCNNLEKVFYQKGSCPKAEDFSRTILNLPTYPTLTKQEAKKIVSILKKF